MSDAFDPYYIWLGIPPDEQPANHYRLLGVTLFEENSEVIEAAANRQMAYLQELAGGDAHIDAAQNILGQLSQARVCLLNAAKKKAYDERLRVSFDSRDQVSKSGVAKKASEDGPLMPPTIFDTAAEPDAKNRKQTTLPDNGPRATEPTGSSRRKKQSSQPLTIALVAIGIVALVATWFLLNGSNSQEPGPVTLKDHTQQDQSGEEKDEPNPEVIQAREALRDAEARAAEAEQQLKKEQARKAAEEAARKAKEEQARQVAEEAARKAKEEQARQVAEEAALKAKEEQARQAAEEAARKAKNEEEARKAEELRDNPDRLLQTKGFHQKEQKWIFSAQDTLNRYSKELSKAWKAWKKTPVTTDSEIQAKLQKYNDLLLKTIEVNAMRQAVSEELTRALEDPAVSLALSSLEVNTSELARDAKALQRPDKRLYKIVPKEPVIGSFAALIINEQEGIVMHADKQLMGTHDAPQLFILPRAACNTIGFVPTQNSLVQKKVNDAYTMNLATVTIPRIRFGFRVIDNGTFQTPLSQAEGVPHTDITAYSGKVGSQAWQIFRSRLRTVKVSHSPTAINKAKQQLDDFKATLDKSSNH